MRSCFYKNILCLFFLLTLVFPPNMVYAANAFASADFEQNASSNFAGIPNKADKAYLDDFIEIFNGSEAADRAFTLRFNLTRGQKDIAEYNEFIHKYDSTLAGQMAIQEVYELYARRQSIPSYLAFLDSYPNTAQAYAAKLHLHGLLFELSKAIAEDKSQSPITQLEAIDAFIDMNAEAPQVPAAIMLAKAVLAGEEQKNRDAIKIEADRLQATGELKDGFQKTFYIDSMTQKAANSIATRFEVYMNTVDKYLIDDKTFENLPPDDRTDALAIMREAERVGFVIQTVYADQDAAARVRTEQRFIKTAKILTGIQTAIYVTNKELISVIKDEFQKTRDQLSNQLGAIESQLKGVNSRLDILHADMELANDKLGKINDNIIIVQKNIKEVSSLQSQTNELIKQQTDATQKIGQVLDQDLRVLHDSVIHLNNDLNSGLTEQKQAINNLTVEVKTGMNLLHQDAVAAYQQNAETREALINEFHSLENTVDAGFQKVDSRLVEMNDSAIKMHYQSMAQNADLNGRLMDNINQNAKAEIEANFANTAAIRGDLGMINNSIDYSTKTVTAAIYDSGSMVAQSVDRASASINQTIVKQSDRQIYKLDQIRTDVNSGFSNVNNHLDSGFASVNKSVQTFQKDFNNYAAKSQTSMATLIQETKRVSSAANQTTGMDAQADIKGILKGLGQDAEKYAKNVITSKLCDVSKLNSEQCDDIAKQLTDGKISKNVLVQAGSQFVCAQAKIKDPALCESLANGIGTGTFDYAKLGGVAVQMACEQAGIKIAKGFGCKELAQSGEIVMDIYSGNWVGAAQAVAPIVAKLVPKFVQGLTNVVNDFGKTVGGWLGL